MTDEDQVRKSLLAKQAELAQRVGSTQREESIAEARLKALPYATLCIQCAESAEGSS